MDLLLKSAETWKKLLKTEYYIEISKNGKNRQLSLNFLDIEFFHLAGFQKAKDVFNTEAIRSNIVERIISGEITFTQLQKSSNYNYSIKPRLTVLSQLEELLDNNFKIYKFDKSLLDPRHPTLIEAEYVNRGLLILEKPFYFLIQEIKTLSIAVYLYLR